MNLTSRGIMLIFILFYIHRNVYWPSHESQCCFFIVYNLFAQIFYIFFFFVFCFFLLQKFNLKKLMLNIKILTSIQIHEYWAIFFIIFWLFICNEEGNFLFLTEQSQIHISKDQFHDIMPWVKSIRNEAGEHLRLESLIPILIVKWNEVVKLSSLSECQKILNKKLKGIWNCSRSVGGNFSIEGSNYLSPKSTLATCLYCSVKS